MEYEPWGWHEEYHGAIVYRKKFPAGVMSLEFGSYRSNEYRTNGVIVVHMYLKRKRKHSMPMDDENVSKGRGIAHLRWALRVLDQFEKQDWLALQFDTAMLEIEWGDTLRQRVYTKALAPRDYRLGKSAEGYWVLTKKLTRAKA